MVWRHLTAGCVTAGRPFDYLRFDVYAQMKEDVKTGYFEELIRKYLLNSTHGTILTAVPKRGLTAEKDALLADKLQTYKASLSGGRGAGTRRVRRNS